MQLEDIKKQIEDSNIKDSFIIFKGDNSFIARQYYQNIAKILNLDINYIEEITSLTVDSSDIFGIEEDNNSLRVYNCDTFNLLDNKLCEQKNVIVICKKIDKETQNVFKEYIIEVPDLVEWQIKDYVYSTVDGIDSKYLDWLISICNNNIDRIQLEIDKLMLFEAGNRQNILQQMVEENAFMDVSNKTIFDFITSLLKKDINGLKEIYEDIESIDIEDIGVVTLLYNNFKKYIQVWMQNNPTPETTGLSSKQIWAINKLPRIWSAKDLVDILTLLTEMDYRLKTGAIPVNMIRDYLVVNLLSR